MDDRPQFILDLSFTEREPAAPPDELHALVPPAEALPGDDLADEPLFLDDYTLAVRDRSAEFDDYAPSYADDLDLPDADFEL